jgi:23S rRNA (guanosine2251-2'-O)-methyltransferase
MNGEMVYGWHVVEALLRNRPDAVKRVVVGEQRQDARLKQLKALQPTMGFETRAMRELDAWLPDAVHQGIVAFVTPAREWNDDQLWDRLDQIKHPPLLLVLDGVTDPHNLGACLRTADASGVDAVIIPKDRAVGLTATVRKVSAGASETVPLVTVTNLARFLTQCRERGLWVVGTKGEADKSLYDADLKGPLVLVLGAEGSGMRRLTEENCDFCVHMPMRGAVESLNVSVATGVLLYEALRQRR